MNVAAPAPNVVQPTRHIIRAETNNQEGFRRSQRVTRSVWPSLPSRDGETNTSRVPRQQVSQVLDCQRKEEDAPVRLALSPRRGINFANDSCFLPQGAATGRESAQNYGKIRFLEAERASTSDFPAA